MAKRYYLSTIVTGGLGVRPALSSIGVPYSSHSLPGTNGAVGLVEADVSPAEHATIVADPQNIPLPFVASSDGSLLSLTDPVSLMSSASRTAVANRAETLGIPLGWVSGSTTVGEIIRFFVRRLLLRQHLSADDWNEGLDTLISAIPAAKRTRIRDRLDALGLDTSVILPSDTIREAIRKVAQQNTPSLKTPYDS